MDAARTFRNVVAGALIAATPISGTFAAVRPNAAVPIAASASTSAQGEASAVATAWLPIGIMIATLALGIYYGTHNPGNGHRSLSRG